MQEHQNVNTTLPLHTALFEVERGPCFQLPIVPLKHTMQLNSHKRTEGSMFYCGILLKKPSEVLLCDLCAFFCFWSFIVHFPHFSCVFVYPPVPPLSSVEQSVFCVVFFIHVYVRMLFFIY